MPRPAKRLKSSEEPVKQDVEETVAGIQPRSSFKHLKSYPASKVYRLLEPGPVVLVSTADKDGSSPNLMTMGFHMVIQHEDPPLLGAIIGPWDHSYKALKATGQCVIAIPGVDLAEKVVDIGNCKGYEVDKFEKFGLTPVESSKVVAPLVGEALANVECEVHDKSQDRKYHLWILRPVKAWVNGSREEKRTFHHKGDGKFVVDGDEINLQDRMILWKEYQDNDSDE